MDRRGQAGAPRRPGTDGFGRSDARGALRAFFEVDRRRHAGLAALDALTRGGVLGRELVREALDRYQVDLEPRAVQVLAPRPGGPGLP